MVLAVVLGVLVGLFDAFVDSLLLYEGSFLDNAILDVSPFELYMRLMILACFLGFGLVVSRHLRLRREAEESVRRAKQEWERTFDTVPDAIAIIDPDHGVVRVNRAAADRLGVAPEDCGEQQSDCGRSDVSSCRHSAHLHWRRC